jgi:hypothetical protein
VAYAHDIKQGARVLDEDWPGAEGETRRKVPTLLVYSKKSATPTKEPARLSSSQSMLRASSRPTLTSSLSSWGFKCSEPSEQNSNLKETKQFFKLFLDDDYLRRLKERSSNVDISHEDVCMWYKDFLTKLYQHIKSYFMAKKPDLWRSKVRFVFSVPTTWTEARVVDRFKAIIRDAGFGTESNHSAAVSMTESQAAAVATITEKDHLLKRGQTVMVVDAGGGTTDLAMLQVQSMQGQPLKLKSIHHVTGRTVGSTHIDGDFRQYAKAKINKLNETEIASGRPAKIKDVDAVVNQMSADRTFQRHKHYLSPEILEDDVPFQVAIPGLSTTHADLGIENGNLSFRPSEMAKFFNKRLETVYEAIDEQFRALSTLDTLSERERKVDFMILSGGLGSSKYVMDKIQRRYCSTQSNSRYHGMELLQAAQPQTVVCQGLVIDEMSTIHNKTKPLQNWISHRSYGIVGIKEFDRKIHLERDRIRGDDVLDRTGNSYVDNQITWVVDKVSIITSAS